MEKLSRTELHEHGDVILWPQLGRVNWNRKN